MLVGLGVTIAYIVYFKFLGGTPDQWLFGISPEGFGTVGMLLNFIVAMVVATLTPAPPQEIRHIIEDIRIPRGAAEAHVH